jgi:hypothetical protein
LFFQLSVPRPVSFTLELSVSSFMEKEKSQRMKTAFEFVGRAHVPSEWRQSDYDYDIETLANLTKSVHRMG